MNRRRLILSASIALVLLLASVIAGFTFAQSLTRAHADNLEVGTKWYFAEGRVGKGFREYFTVSNPTVSSCTVQFEYLYVADGGTANSTKIVTSVVKAQSRLTESVNADLGVSGASPTGTTNSTVVDVDQGATPTCSQVVVERPMYFVNFNNVSSGTDIIGVNDPPLGTGVTPTPTPASNTSPTSLSTQFFFADVPTGTAGSSWLTILNPQQTTANVQVEYFVQSPDEASANAPGTIKNYQTLSVPPMSRGTIQPGNLNMPYPHVAAIVNSDVPILVERPSYFSLTDGYNVTGAADVIGAHNPAPTWYFAEGQAPHVPQGVIPNTQENLIIANPDPTNAVNVTVTLISAKGATHTYTLPTLQPYSQTIWDVNKNNLGFPSATNDLSTSDVAIRVTSSSATHGVVVQRQIYQTYQGVNVSQLNAQTGWSASSVTDTMGATAPVAPGHSYNFAEGYAAQFYNEWLMLLNTTGADETVTVKLTNSSGHTYTQSVALPANSRVSDNITQVVEQNMVQIGDANSAYEVSMVVSSTGNFVAERSEYFHPVSYPVQGGDSVVGYAS